MATYGALDLDGDLAPLSELLSDKRQADLNALGHGGDREESKSKEGLHCTGMLVWSKDEQEGKWWWWR